MVSSVGPRRLRIAFPFNQLEIGGAEIRALRLAEHLPPDRFETHFISSSGPGTLDQRARDAKATIHYVGNRPVASSGWPVRISGRLDKALRYAALARTSQFDVVNAWLYPADAVAAFGRLVTRMPPVLIAGRFNEHRRDAFGPVSAAIDAWVNARMDAIVANSEIVAGREQGRPGVDPAKLHVIRNGVEILAPIPEPERRRIRSLFGADDGDILIGSVGNLRAVKRHELLVDAFADLLKTLPNIRLLIIGEGPMRGSLEHQIRRLGLDDRIAMPGAITDVRPMLDAMDIVALSSSSEGLPNALIEGAAAGRPIVTTAAGGAVETVVDGVTGLVVPVGDRAALVRALKTLIQDAPLRRRYGRAAREHAESRFGMDRFVREWAMLYEGLAVTKGLLRLDDGLQ